VDDEAKTRFNDFVTSRTPALMRFAYLLTGDRHAAEDLLQSALAKTVARWQSLRHEDPEGYVRTAMLREQISWWRRLRRVRETPLGDAVEVVGDDHSDRTDLRLATRNALLRLPMAQRAVLVLRYYEDLTETQVAAAMGCSVGTVRSRTHRAVARLRQLLPELDRTGVLR
jgi:RNA polymerase sigma-70 factor (sigma-E family)